MNVEPLRNIRHPRLFACAASGGEVDWGLGGEGQPELVLDDAMVPNPRPIRRQFPRASYPSREEN